MCTSLAALQQLPDYVNLIVCIRESWKAPWQLVGEFLFVSAYWLWLEMADPLCFWKPAIKSWTSGIWNCFVSIAPAFQVVGWVPLIMMSQCLHALVCITPESQRNERELWLVSNWGLLIEGLYVSVTNIWKHPKTVFRFANPHSVKNKHWLETSCSN